LEKEEYDKMKGEAYVPLAMRLFKPSNGALNEQLQKMISSSAKAEGVPADGTSVDLNG